MTNRWLTAYLTALTVCAQTAASTAEASPALDLARQLNQAFVEVAENVSPSVVVVQVARRSGYHDFGNMGDSFWDLLPEEFRDQLREQHENQPEERPENRTRRRPVFDARASGVIIRKEGYILTNRHVVEGADQIRVKLLDGSEYEATIQGEDVQSDIAVLKIETAGLRAIKIGDSDKTRVGEFAIAIGAPFDLDYSVTFGHVSAKGRSRIIQDMTMDQDFIQTDANINPGNSGGPLVNIEGEIIGVNTLIRGLRTGIGFAVPINLAMEVAEKLITDGKYVRSWLGIGIETLREHRDYRQLVTEIEDGVVVTEIRTNGPSYKSQLKANDIITAVDGHKVASVKELKSVIRSKPAGENVTLDVHRLVAREKGGFQGNDIQVDVTPEPWPETMLPVLTRYEPPVEQKSTVLGMTVQALTEELAEQYGAKALEGVIVTEVESGSEASLKGVRPGDIITEVNQKAVGSPQAFLEAMGEANLKKGVIVNFTSRGTSRFFILKESGD